MGSAEAWLRWYSETRTCPVEIAIAIGKEGHDFDPDFDSDLDEDAKEPQPGIAAHL